MGTIEADQVVADQDIGTDRECVEFGERCAEVACTESLSTQGSPVTVDGGEVADPAALHLEIH